MLRIDIVGALYMLLAASSLLLSGLSFKAGLQSSLGLPL